MSSATGPARWSTPISLIRLEGADTRRFLHGQSSQAIELAPSGACLPTCLISPTGRMRALALVRLDASGADLLVLAGDGVAVHQALDRVLFPADQVKLSAVQSAAVVRWCGAEPDGINPTAAASAHWLAPGVNLGAGQDQPAWLQCSGDPLPTWLEALPELSAEAAEQLRLRQGFPAAPGELNDSTNPFELGLAPWVSLNKGCYVGQETLAKLATYDGVKQQLRYWRSSTSSPAAAKTCIPGALLTTAAGERAGVITSAAAGAQGLEGLALVRRQALEEAHLVAGGGDSDGEPLPLQISIPAGFVAPPVGAGGRG
jgi:folate-binding protein YgfZ